MTNKINILLGGLVISGLLNNLIFSSCPDLKDILFLLPALFAVIYFIRIFIYEPVVVKRERRAEAAMVKINNHLLSRQNNYKRGI